MDDDVNADIDSIMRDDEQTTTTVEGTPTNTASTTEAVETPKQEEKDSVETDKTVDGADTEPPKVQEVETPKTETTSPTEQDKTTVEEPAKPLTADEVRAIVTEIRNDERSSGKNLADAEKEILDIYYPQGLSNVLVDEKSGQAIRTPQDVVDLSGGTMTIEEGAQWLINEQYKLDTSINEIKTSARELAEVNSNFKQGSTNVVNRYEKIFEAYPGIQEKVYRNYMKNVKIDNDKDIVLSAPDIEEYYADVMEPYVMAFGYQAPVQPAPAPPTVAIPESKQTAEDRMDVGGDGGGSSDADPTDPESSLNKVFGE